MRRNANTMLDNEECKTKNESKSEEACKMRVKSLKKTHLRRTICKAKKMQEEQSKGGIYHTATINTFSPINDAGKPLSR